MRVSLNWGRIPHFKTRCLISWRELDQFGFYGPWVVIIQSGKFNDAPGLGTVEVSYRHIGLPPKPTTSRPALGLDKFVSFGGRGHLFHSSNTNLNRPSLIPAGVRGSC